MKVNQKYVVIMLVAVLMLTLCVTAFAEAYQILYAADGRSKSFPVSKVEAQLKVGWYTEPVTTVYAEDGRTKVIKKTDLAAYRNVGWYSYPVQRLYHPDRKSEVFSKDYVSYMLLRDWYEEPVQRLYALGGKDKVFPKTKVAAQLKVGWYTEPVTTVYAEDGRTKIVKTKEVEAYKKVGWYIYPVQRLYHPDQKSKVFTKASVSYMCRRGWYKEPVQRLYTFEGRSRVFPKTKVAAQLKVGWYEERHQQLYTLEKSQYFLVSQVAAQLKAGWYTEPVIKMYTEDGRTKIVKKTEVEAYKKVGWYDSPVITMYHPDGRTKKITEKEKYEHELDGWHSYKVTLVYAIDGREKAVRPSEVEAYEKVGWSRYPCFKLMCDKNDNEYGQKMIYWKYVPGVKNHTVTIVEKRFSPRGEFAANNIAANKPVVIKNVTSNYVYITTYPNCSYTITVTGGNSKGKKTFYIGSAVNYEDRYKVKENAPQTKEEAEKLMVKITVPVWKLSNGKKISSTATLTVHKDIAEPTKKVFNEIYKGKEKFPFKDIGAYNWRGGTTEHNSGTAIDINSNENYCIYSNGVQVGSHWSPGKDPYSINPYGDVVHAFEKNGFTWGGDAWSSTIDYMHFSYCGT